MKNVLFRKSKCYIFESAKFWNNFLCLCGVSGLCFKGWIGVGGMGERVLCKKGGFRKATGGR